MDSLPKFDQCWYKIINDKFKVDSAKVEQYGIFTYKCDECKFSITSSSYQQNICGSRYCKDCFDKLKPKYYCSSCKEEDANNIVHKREDIFTDKAMIKDLEKMLIDCPDCHTPLKLIDLENHVRKECTMGWTICQTCDSMYKGLMHSCTKTCFLSNDIDLQDEICNSCGNNLKRNEIHECSICWQECCPYGCNEVSSLESHRKLHSLNHMDKIWDIMKEWKLSEYMRNNESTQCENWLTPTIEKLKQAIEFDTNDISSLRAEVSNMLKETIEEKDINNIIETNLCYQMSNVYNTSFDGTIVWRINNFSKIKENAIKGIQKSIFSPPFYSGRFGYKMCLRLYPFGDKAANEKAMSLFLVIMKGHYDSILKWPFKQKVTFILIDPEFKTNWIDAFIPSENMTSFAMPRTDMNIPSGSSYFIKFEDMNQNPFRYARDDTMFIKCIVDCSDLNSKI